MLWLVAGLLVATHVWGQADQPRVALPDQHRMALPNQRQLPVSNIHRILQDRDGFMWYATYGGGLCRDDGYHVDVFRPLQLGSFIPEQSNYIEGISEDTRGRIWMGTRSGLYYVDDKTFELCEPDSTLRSEFIYSVCCMSDSTVWVSLRGVLLHLDCDGQRLGSYTLSDPYQHPVSVRHMIENSHHEMVGCATWNMGLVRYDRQHDKVDFLPWQVNASPQYMVEDQANQCYWVCTWGGGVLKYKDGQALEQARFWSPLADRDNQGKGICMDLATDGTLWVSTMEFLYAYDTRGGSLAPLATSSFLPRELMIIDGITIDRNDNVWVGGFTPGTFILSRLNHQIRRDSVPAIPRQLGIRSIPERLSVDRNGGRWIYQSRIGMLYITPSGECVRTSDSPRFPTLSNTFCPTADADGLWICNQKDVDRLWYDGRTIREEMTVHVYDDINNIADDGRGHLLIGGRNSLSRYDIRSQKLSRLMEDCGSIKSVCSGEDGSVYCISETSGVIRVTPAGKVESVLEGRGFSALSISSDQTLYAGTSDGRVFVRNRGKQQFQECDVLRSKAGEAILGILTDTLGHVWTMTDQNVREANTASRTWRTIGCHDAEVGVDFFEDMCYANGEVWLGGPGGIVAISPNQAMDRPTHSVQPFVSAIVYNGTRRVLDPHSREFILPSNTQNASVEFTTLDYLHAHSIQYRYRLVGYDTRWIFLPEGTNTATFAHLPAGRYTLEVKATDRYGSWSTNVATLQIRRMPAWWETWWFRTFVFVVACTAVCLVLYLLYHRQMRHKQLQLEGRLAEMKLQFFTNVSHELRTPLTLITTPLETISQRLSSSTTIDEPTTTYVKSKLKGISIHCHELTEMINRLLDFRKLEMKQQTLHLSGGDVMEFLRSALESFRPLAEKQGIALGINLSQASFYMNFDADKLHHVMSNLLSNAVKFTQSGGSIVVSAHTLADNRLEVVVADTGVGIDEHDLPHIFERYYQSGNAQGGAGIGLQLVDSFCRLHGGKVSVESRLGQGTTFTILLPTDLQPHAASAQPQTTEQAAAETPEASPETTQQQRSTILVVDDNAELRELLVDEFHTTYNILQAADGQEAIDLLQREEVDLVVSDVMMPRMDGYELCEAIRRDINTSHLLVVLLTAKTAEDSKLQGFRSGADAYLSKPFSMEMLKVRIATLLQQRSVRHHAFQHQEEVDVEQTAIDPLDRDFLTRAIAAVEQHMDDEEYDVETFCADLAMSKSTLYRKLGSISGQKPKEFIRTIRLKHAVRLLRSGRYTVSEVAARTGFSYVSYFCRCFKEMYGVQPGNYRE